MEEDPRKRLPRRNMLIAAAAVSGTLAVGLSFANGNSNTANCEVKISDPASILVCPVIKLGTAVKGLVSDELSTQLQHIP